MMKQVAAMLLLALSAANPSSAVAPKNEDISKDANLRQGAVIEITPALSGKTTTFEKAEQELLSSLWSALIVHSPDIEWVTARYHLLPGRDSDQVNALLTSCTPHITNHIFPTAQPGPVFFHDPPVDVNRHYTTTEQKIILKGVVQNLSDHLRDRYLRYVNAESLRRSHCVPFVAKAEDEAFTARRWLVDDVGPDLVDDVDRLWGWTNPN